MSDATERRERAAVRYVAMAKRTIIGEEEVSSHVGEHIHVDGQLHGEAHVYDVVYRSIVAAAEKEGAVEGDPRWYGVSIALRAIIELRDRKG